MHSKHEEHMSPVPEVLEELRAGRMIVLVDDPDREDEGDLVLAAEKVTPQAIAFMAKEASGLVCLAMTGEQLDQLQLPPMARRNTARLGTAFTVSIEARHGVTTGISAADRAHTILAAIADDARPDDLVTPGHVFPLRARDGGVLVRTGQTEGSVDLARLAGLKPAAVICEVMNPDGTMSRVPELVQFCRKHGLKMTSVAHVIAWRHAKERLIERVTRARMPSAYGHFDAYLYKSTVDAVPHMVLTIGLPGPDEQGRFAPLADPVLVRVHSECLTGDVFGSLRCDCGAQLHQAMQVIGAEGRGAMLYMRQEGRGIGLENKMRAYHLQDLGYDTVEANRQLGFRPDERDFGIGAQILADLGIRKMRLLTNNPKKYTSLAGYDLEIVERVPLEIGANENNIHYLRTKREKLGHLLKGV